MDDYLCGLEAMAHVFNPDNPGIYEFARAETERRLVAIKKVRAQTYD